MRYLDTSVLVPLVVPEALSGAVERWFDAAKPESLATSRWSGVEFAGAVGNRVRRQELTEAAGRAAIEMYERRVAPALSLVAVEDGDFVAAIRLVGKFGLGLRGGDALHLAVARRIGAARLVTLDRRLAAAALAAGLGAEEPLPGS
jgi:uncharacterized protein